jgi:hypothetical protein
MSQLFCRAGVVESFVGGGGVGSNFCFLKFFVRSSCAFLDLGDCYFS